MFLRDAYSRVDCTSLAASCSARVHIQLFCSSVYMNVCVCVRVCACVCVHVCELVKMLWEFWAAGGWQRLTQAGAQQRGHKSGRPPQLINAPQGRKSGRPPHFINAPLASPITLSLACCGSRHTSSECTERNTTPIPPVNTHLVTHPLAARVLQRKTPPFHSPSVAL